MRALVIPLLFLCCLMLAFVYVLVNTPYVLNTMLVDVINDHAKGFVLEEFHCARQKGRLPDVVSIFDVTMKIRQGERVYDIEADEIVIQNFFEFVKKQELLRLAARGIVLKTGNIDVQDGQIKAVIRLSDFKILFMETMAFAKEFQFGPYLFSEISTHIKGNPSKIEIYEMKGSAYGGTVSGQLTFDQVPEFNYVLWSEFDGIETRQIAQVYPMPFGKMEGRFGGSMRLVGGKEADIFAVMLSAKEGLTISPALFLQVSGIFDETEKAEVTRLSDQGKTLIAQTATLHIQNGRAGKILLVFDIQEAVNHFVLKGSVPVDWPGRLETFLFPQRQSQSQPQQ